MECRVALTNRRHRRLRVGRRAPVKFYFIFFRLRSMTMANTCLGGLSLAADGASATIRAFEYRARRRAARISAHDSYRWNLSRVASYANKEFDGVSTLTHNATFHFRRRGEGRIATNVCSPISRSETYLARKLVLNSLSSDCSSKQYDPLFRINKSISTLCVKLPKLFFFFFLSASFLHSLYLRLTQEDDL